MSEAAQALEQVFGLEELRNNAKLLLCACQQQEAQW